VKIYKSKRKDLKGRFHHKMPRIGATKAKKAALKDISDHCKENGGFTRNYVHVEYLVLQISQINKLK